MSISMSSTFNEIMSNFGNNSKIQEIIQRNQPKRRVKAKKVIKKEVAVGTEKIVKRQRKTQVCSADLGIPTDKDKLKDKRREITDLKG